MQDTIRGKKRQLKEIQSPPHTKKRKFIEIWFFSYCLPFIYYWWISKSIDCFGFYALFDGSCNFGPKRSNHFWHRWWSLFTFTKKNNIYDSLWSFKLFKCIWNKYPFRIFVITFICLLDKIQINKLTNYKWQVENLYL